MTFMLEEVAGKEVSITESGESVLTYCYSESVSHSYFHPIYAPNGQVVTEQTEETKPRHLPGICFSFGTVKDENGIPILLNRSIPKLDQGTSKSSSSKDLVEFVQETTWKDSHPLLIETCYTKIYASQNDIRILDVEVVLQAPSKTIEFVDDIGLGYYAAEMEHRKAADSSGRIGESEVNGQEAEWVTLCGIVSNTAVGVAILSHPDNGQTLFRAEDAYLGYLLAQTQPFSLNANATRTLKYRVLIYIGDLFTVDISDYYQSYLPSNDVSL